MANNDNFKSTVGTLMDGMNGFFSSKTVVGEPLTFGDTTIIPLVDVSFGMGAGSFANDRNNNGAGGMGGRLKPTAVVVIRNGSARLINVSTNTGFDRLLDMVPDFVDRVATKIEGEKHGDKKTRAKAKKEMEEMMEDSVNKSEDLVDAEFEEEEE